MSRNHHPSSRQRRALAAALALVLGCTAASVAAQALSPAFTYQGELRSAGTPANASFDMEFRLYSTLSGSGQIGPVVTRLNVPVTNGLFSVPLDFGAAQFAGERQWLEIAIRPAGGGAYETLSPRTEVTAAPYAWSAAVALGNSVTTTSIVDGTIGTTDINAAQVQRRVTGNCAAGQYVQSVNQDGTLTCASDANSGGTVTSVATGAGLTGGPITATGTIAVAPGGIGTTQINATQVQRRVSGSCTGANFVQQINADGTVGCGAAPGASGWSLSGNSATNPATNFIGTTDAQAFSVRTNNQRVAVFEAIALSGPAGGHTANVLLGSRHNTITAGVRGATISGGGVQAGDSEPDFGNDAPNQVSDHYGTIGGGYANRAGDNAGATNDRAFATVGGGGGNTASGPVSTIAGGFANTVTGDSGTVGGGQVNTASGDSSTIAGGISNTTSGSTSTVGGGGSNTAIGNVSTVGGGSGNTASGFTSTVGGGFNNTASGGSSTVGGGEGSIASGFFSTVGGGNVNTASGSSSTVSGGEGGTASGSSSTVGGGSGNCAGGDFSWAGGNRAKVRPGITPAGGACSGLAPYPGGSGDAGTFVWADSQNANFVSTGDNQFLVRAAGGAVFTGNSAVNDPLGNRLRVDGTLRVDALGTAAATTLCRNASNQISGCSSSARYKQDIADLELGLATALRLHAVGYRWKNTGDADVGFVAEEIAAIDERLITRNAKGEIEGVKYERLTAVLANAVQELAARDSLAAEEREELTSRVDALNQENAALRARLDAIEARLGGQK